MKIAYIYDGVYPWVKGGVEKRVYEISKGLAERGHEVHWFGVKWWPDDNEVINHDGITLHGVCKPMELYINGRRSIKEAIYFASTLLPKLIRDRFDIVDCQQFPYLPCFPAKVYSLFMNSPLIITWHEVWDDYWYEYLGRKCFLGWVVERMIAKLPNIIIAVSEGVKNDLNAIGVSATIIKVVPNGVDFYKIKSVKPSEEEFDVIYIGRLLPHKNVDVLLKAVAILKKEFPNVKCGIIGDGPEANRLRGLSNELDLDDNVKFFGFLQNDEDVYSYMKSSKLFVLPSTREGFSVVTLEANACGLPVITVRHRHNAAVELVRDGYNGFIVNLSPEEIAKVVAYLLQDEDELRKLGRNAIEFVKRYDWGGIVKKLEDVYSEVLYGSKG